jgi:hypothetical protein
MGLYRALLSVSATVLVDAADDGAEADDEAEVEDEGALTSINDVLTERLDPLEVRVMHSFSASKSSRLRGGNACGVRGAIKREGGGRGRVADKDRRTGL